MNNLKEIRLIQLQTISSCSGGCVICPYPNSWHKNNPGQMSDEEFLHVIKEIDKNIGKEFKGQFCPYLMNECLMDKKIIDRIEIIYQYFPKCHLEISTNAMQLLPNVSEKLISLIDRHHGHIWISHHAIDEESYKTIMQRDNYKQTLQNITDYLKINDGRIQTMISGGGVSIDGIINFFGRNQYFKYIQDIIEKNNLNNKNLKLSYLTFHNRAGNVYLKHWDSTEFHRELMGFKCWRYDTGLHILFDLSVISCCMDYKKETAWGNLKEQSLKEIWNSEKRKRFIEKAENIIPSDYNFLCKLCMRPGG